MKKILIFTIIILFFSCKHKQINAKKEISNLTVEKRKDTTKNTIEKIEKNIKSKSISNFKKQVIDLDNDNDLDLIYIYQCSELKCIKIYLNIDENYKEVISEFCYEYILNDDNKDRQITIKQNHCCGESPFTSLRTFIFRNDKDILYDNYVIFNESKEMLFPKKILQNYYEVKIINDDYNVRFSPNIRKYSEDESEFSCEENTNIIGKLKKGSIINVLSEIKKENRTWLFVEIKKSNLNTESCSNPISYDFENQKLRAWISNRFTEKIIK